MLELWFDFSCPYAYLASHQARTLGVPNERPVGGARSTPEGARGLIDWRPMLLGGVFRGAGAGDGPMATLSPQKARHNLADMHRWAAHLGVPFRMPDAHPMRTVRALRVLLALPHSRWPAAIEAIYAAYWQRGEDITSDAVLAAALAAIPEAHLAFAHADDVAIKDELRRRTDEAVGLGIFGAPAWISRPHLIWGQDRLPWVQAMAAGWNPDTDPPDGPHRIVAPPGGSVDPPVLPSGSASPSAHGGLEAFFDVASPFSYLGLTQVGGLATRLVPILLGGLFRAIGTPDVPLLGFPPAKQRYVNADMHRWARWWGVPFRTPTKFPQRTVAAQRLCVVAAERDLATQLVLAQALGRAMWAEDRDLEDDATLRQILDGLGLPVAWLARTQEPAVKQALIANTEEAKARGVFGVPTWIVRGDELYWGQDRLALAAAAR